MRTRRKINISISIKLENYDKVQKLGVRLGRNDSQVIDYVLDQLKQEEEVEEVLPELVKCDVCGTEYSGSLVNCPACEAESLKLQRQRQEEAIFNSKVLREKELVLEKKISAWQEFLATKSGVEQSQLFEQINLVKGVNEDYWDVAIRLGLWKYEGG